MKTKDVKIGHTYTARVSGSLVRVKVTAEMSSTPRYRVGRHVGEKHGGYSVVNLTTQRRIILSAARLRGVGILAAESYEDRAARTAAQGIKGIEFGQTIAPPEKCTRLARELLYPHAVDHADEKTDRAANACPVVGQDSLGGDVDVDDLLRGTNTYADEYKRRRDLAPTAPTCDMNDWLNTHRPIMQLCLRTGNDFDEAMRTDDADPDELKAEGFDCSITDLNTKNRGSDQTG